MAQPGSHERVHDVLASDFGGNRVVLQHFSELLKFSGSAAIRYSINQVGRSNEGINI